MQVFAGTYVMRIVPKSGSPVLGHIDVNSGQSIAISNGRPGRGLGNVSSPVLDILENSNIHGRNPMIFAAHVIDTRVNAALGYAGFRHGSALLAARATCGG